MNEFDRFKTPFEERYSSKEMLYLFSPNKKFSTWRKLWIALAESEKELGLNITQEQINEMKNHIMLKKWRKSLDTMLWLMFILLVKYALLLCQ